jgi:hypothetical protein
MVVDVLNVVLRRKIHSYKDVAIGNSYWDSIQLPLFFKPVFWGIYSILLRNF